PAQDARKCAPLRTHPSRILFNRPRLILSGMVRLSVMYPATPNSRFDWDYYLGPHLVLAKKLLAPYGLIRIEVDRGIAAFPPGAALPFHAVGHLFFPSAAQLEQA